MTKNDSAPHSSGSPRSRRRRSTRGGGQSSSNKQRKNRSRNNQSNRQRNRNNSNRNSSNQKAAARHNQPRRSNLEHSDLPLSVETSAGGIVLSGLAEAVRGNGSVDTSKIYAALIGRLDRRGRLLWSMPKGHVEENESTHRTAEREVWEETGIAGTVIAELGTIDYWFVSEGTRIHKTVHHHLLRFVDGELNDEDPEVTEVTWVPVNHLVERLAYADERRLARRALNTLPDLARAEADAGRTTPR